MIRLWKKIWPANRYNSNWFESRKCVRSNLNFIFFFWSHREQQHLETKTETQWKKKRNRTYHKHNALVQLFPLFSQIIQIEFHTKFSSLHPLSFHLVFFLNYYYSNQFTLVFQFAICFTLFCFFFFFFFNFVYQFLRSVSMFQFHFSSIHWIH